MAIGDEYREEEARRRYRISHPLVERTRINPLDAVIELSLPFFKSNTEATEFKIYKAELGKIWNLSINPQNRMIGELVSEYPFITDSHKGFLIIERQGIEDYQKVMEQRQDQQERVKTINEEYPRMMKDIEELEERIKNFMEEKYNPLKERKEQQENRLKKLEEESKKFEQIIKDNDSKLTEAKSKVEELKKESKKVSDELSQANKELEGIDSEQNKMIVDIQTKQGMIKRKKNMTPEQILKEKIDKLSAENEDLKSEKEEIEEKMRSERHEILKGFFLFLFIIGFALLVEYGLWHFFSNNILLFVIFSVLFLIIYYLLLSRL